MTLDQLRVFVAAAERLHVTRAAAELNMTQSAASAAIRALETGLNTSLFNRIGRTIELTAAGQVLLPEAKLILNQVDHAARALADIETLTRGRLSLWASQTIAGYWLPHKIAQFRGLYPGVAVSLTIGNTSEVARAVILGTADLGFVEGSVDDASLVTVPVDADQLVLVVGTGHPWAKRDRLRPKDLLELNWVLRERGSGTRQAFEDALRSHRLDVADLTVVLELPSNESVRAAVEAGAGATVISQFVASAGIAAGTLAVLPMKFPPRAFAAIRHRERHRTRAETAFLDQILGRRRKPAAGARCA